MYVRRLSLFMSIKPIESTAFRRVVAVLNRQGYGDHKQLVREMKYADKS